MITNITIALTDEVYSLPPGEHKVHGRVEVTASTLWLHLSNPEPVKKTPCPHEHVALREDDDSVPGRPYCTDCGDDVPRIPMLTTDYLIAITEPPPRQGLLGPIRDRARVVEVEALDKPEANNLEHVLEQVSVPHGSKVYIVPLDLCETYERPTAAKIERRS